MHRPRSTAAPLRRYIIDSLKEADATPAVSFYPVEHLIHARPLGYAFQLAGKELLQRLSTQLCAASKRRVNIFGDVPDQQVRHACILLSDNEHCNHPATRVDGRPDRTVTPPTDRVGSTETPLPELREERSITEAALWTALTPGRASTEQRLEVP